MRGKVKRWKGRPGKRPDYKKAIISLAEGETIDMMSGA
jgi:large subunit ribosomal protein L23